MIADHDYPVTDGARFLKEKKKKKKNKKKKKRKKRMVDLWNY